MRGELELESINNRMSRENCEGVVMAALPSNVWLNFELDKVYIHRVTAGESSRVGEWTN